MKKEEISSRHLKEEEFDCHLSAGRKQIVSYLAARRKCAHENLPLKAFDGSASSSEKAERFVAWD
jgi:hypothetical protein